MASEDRQGGVGVPEAAGGKGDPPREPWRGEAPSSLIILPASGAGGNTFLLFEAT